MASGLTDVLGIGFGPSNLAFAIAVTEHNDNSIGSLITAAFMEKKGQFSWHRGMLLEGATMQVAFLKDLVTLRNPLSPYSFVAYLHHRNRLIDFINHKVIYPTRIEFHDYLEWCAGEMASMVDYGHEVISARPVEEAGLVTHFEVIARDVAGGELVVRGARNLVVAPGLQARMPEHLPSSARVWHSNGFIEELNQLKTEDPTRFMVLGAGQSAAEIADHLCRTYPRAEVCAVFSRIGYSQSDDSPMANRIFDPATVDVVHSSPAEVRQLLAAYHANTNYSVVDADLIGALYRRSYHERVVGTQRFRLMSLSTVTEAREREDVVEVTVKNLHTGASTVLLADALICATGYEPTNPLSLLGDVGPLLESDETGRLRVDRDYRVRADPRMVGGVYLCGGTEHSHGISSSLLSNTAVRAGEILRSVLERRAADLTAPAAPHLR